MNSLTHLRAKNLNVRYGAIHALKGINAVLPDKKITAIIGPSGCGKSTLLKSFNRLIENVNGTKITGSVFVDGIDIYNEKVDVYMIRKKMGLLSQKPYPLPMSIFDNVAYGPRIHGIHDRARLKIIVEKYLTMASLWDEVRHRLKEPASRLSIGQQQRLCLARALAVEPEILLADEPTSALDPVSSLKIENGFKMLKDTYTIVIVTHILRQAKRLADYVIFMYLGELIEHGTAEKIFLNPDNDITKGYIQGLIS